MNPFRIEGQKTIVWELLQDLGWEAPDWIAVPAGNLGNTSAFGKALREAHEGAGSPGCRASLAVQATGANPFYRSFADGFRSRHRVAPETVATAIRIGDPVSHDRARLAIEATRGVVTEVSRRADPGGQGPRGCRRPRLRAGLRGQPGRRAARCARKA